MSIDYQTIVMNVITVVSLFLAIYSIHMTKKYRSEDLLKEKINGLKSKIDKLKTEVMAYNILEQQYMKHIADKEGLNALGIQKQIRKDAQFAENNPSRLRPTFSYNDALNY